MTQWKKKKTAQIGINEHRVYATSPFPSRGQTTERRGTTSQRRGCKDPRLEPPELLGRHGRKTTFKMLLQKKSRFSTQVVEKKKRISFFSESRKRHTGLMHSCRSGSSERSESSQRVQEQRRRCAPARSQRSAVRNI